MKYYLLLLLTLLTQISFSQEKTSIFENYEDSTSYKIVFRVEKNDGDRYIALDNLTIRAKGNDTKVYYMRYGDGLVSSLMIPELILQDIKDFEQKIYDNKCGENCELNVLIEFGVKKIRIPIDLLQEEIVTNFMLFLEQ
ncbi:MAG: hypothetical protein KC454_03775 [Flavobacteriales bacterium]|nr:hypothetical protein [Flavobacteriales bacterium]